MHGGLDAFDGVVAVVDIDPKVTDIDGLRDQHFSNCELNSYSRGRRSLEQNG